MTDQAIQQFETLVEELSNCDIEALRESYNILMSAAEDGDNERISAWVKDVTKELEDKGLNLVDAEGYSRAIEQVLGGA